MGRDFAVDSLQVQQRRFADSIADCGSRGITAEVLTPEHLSACYGVPMQVVEHAPGALLIAPVFQPEEALA